MKKYGCVLFAAVFVLGLFMVTTNAQATEAEIPKIQLSGLIEVGGVWQDTDYKGAGLTEPEDESDLCLTTVELTAEAEVNEVVVVVDRESGAQEKLALLEVQMIPLLTVNDILKKRRS